MARTSEPSLADTYSDLAALAAGWDSTTMTSGSDKKVKRKCDFGNQWETGVNTRAQGDGRPVCLGQEVLSKAPLNHVGHSHPRCQGKYRW